MADKHNKEIETSGGRICVNPFAFGVYLDGAYTIEELFKLGSSLLSDDFIINDINYMPDSFFLDYYWIPWTRFSQEECEKAIERTYYKTRYTGFDEDYFTEYFCINKRKYVKYHQSYIHNFEIKRIIKEIKNLIGDPFGLKALVLGCASGQPMLRFGAYGIECRGIEISPYIIQMSTTMALSVTDYGDFLVDLDMYDNKEFDFVYTSALCYVHEEDIEPLLMNIKRITRKMIINKYYEVHKNKELFPDRSPSWWQRIYKKTGLKTRAVLSPTFACIDEL